MNKLKPPWIGRTECWGEFIQQYRIWLWLTLPCVKEQLHCNMLGSCCAVEWRQTVRNVACRNPVEWTDTDLTTYLKYKNVNSYSKCNKNKRIIEPYSCKCLSKIFWQQQVILCYLVYLLVNISQNKESNVRVTDECTVGDRVGARKVAQYMHIEIRIENLSNSGLQRNCCTIPLCGIPVLMIYLYIYINLLFVTRFVGGSEYTAWNCGVMRVTVGNGKGVERCRSGRSKWTFCRFPGRCD